MCDVAEEVVVRDVPGKVLFVVLEIAVDVSVTWSTPELAVVGGTAIEFDVESSVATQYARPASIR